MNVSLACNLLKYTDFPTDFPLISPLILITRSYGVILKATQAIANYWISVHSQQKGSAPSAYAVLRYSGACAQCLPSDPTPQGYVDAWGLDQIAQVCVLCVCYVFVTYVWDVFVVYLSMRVAARQ